MVWAYILENNDSEKLHNNQPAFNLIKEMEVADDNLYFDMIGEEKSELQNLISAIQNEDCLIIRSAEDLGDTIEEIESVFSKLSEKDISLEQNIFDIIERIKEEAKSGEMTVFADEKLVQLNDKAKKVEKKGVLYPVKSVMGSESYMHEFAPTYRFADHYLNLDKEYAELENQMGLSRGIYTENTVTSGATATEVKRSNSDTISYIDAVHTALSTGNEETLRADGMYLNISPDLWDYSASWFDPFDDPAEQWRTLLEAHNNGAEETTELIMWIHPELSREEAEEKLQRIKDSNTSTSSDAIYANLTQ